MNALVHPITFDDYRQLEGINQSTIKRFGMAPTPMHFKHEQDHPREDSDAIRIGRAVDCLMFRPTDFDAEFITFLGRRAGKDWESFAAENDGKTILNKAENDRVEGCVEALGSDAEFMKAIKYSRNQVAAIAEDPEFGTLKALIDILPPLSLGWVFDLKTACSGESAEFGKTAHNLGYEIQAALTLHILRTMGEPRDFFGLFIVENEAPFAVCHKKFEANSLAIEDAMRRLRQWIPRYRECKATNVWPGYGNEWQDVAIPAWAMRNV
jgi:hypothetical protein